MNVLTCRVGMRRGWWCSRMGGHRGTCALRPSWWNLAGHLRDMRARSW